MQPALDYVFFVDGDCEVVPGWLEKSKQFLDQHGDVAVVSGLRRERFPEKSIYNLLIDIEWREYLFGDASWLNMAAEIEIGVLQRQCSSRCAGEQAILTTEVAAWQRRRNAARCGIEWTFTRRDSDRKLSRHYVS